TMPASKAPRVLRAPPMQLRHLYWAHAASVSQKRDTDEQFLSTDQADGRFSLGRRHVQAVPGTAVRGETVSLPVILMRDPREPNCDRAGSGRASGSRAAAKRAVEASFHRFQMK